MPRKMWVSLHPFFTASWSFSWVYTNCLLSSCVKRDFHTKGTSKAKTVPDWMSVQSSERRFLKRSQTFPQALVRRTSGGSHHTYAHPSPLRCKHMFRNQTNMKGSNQAKWYVPKSSDHSSPPSPSLVFSSSPHPLSGHSNTECRRR